MTRHCRGGKEYAFSKNIYFREFPGDLVVKLSTSVAWV